MENIDIFKQGNEIGYEWASLKNIGDSVQGTLIGRHSGQNQFKQEQWIYELLDSNNKILWVGINKSKKRTLEQLAYVKVGQIVGFKYVENNTFKTRAGTSVTEKVIKIFADEKIVNSKWLAEHPNARLDRDSSPISDVPEGNDMGEGPVGDVPGGWAPTEDAAADKAFAGFGVPEASPIPQSAPVVISNEEKLKRINDLARIKLNVVDESQVKDKVMDATGIAFIPVNYDKIISALMGIAS